MQRLIGADVDWQDRTHFYALSARMMRRILVNHASAKRSAKRGGNALRVTIQEGHGSTDAGTDADLIALDVALSELASFDARKAEVIELHYFAGLTYSELAEVVGIAESTVHQELRIGKAWLLQRLAD
jgi:RNA polymerase sigma factor (TIGR02999 family)